MFDSLPPDQTKPEKLFTVSEFNEFINVYLAQTGEVVIEGEISELKLSQNKWIFATIKDEKASLDIFGTVFQVSNYRQLEPGMLVKVVGTPSLYQKTGRFSFTATQIAPSGQGSLQIAFEKLFKQLEQEGLFEPTRKRILPEYPERIGLITAKGSQAYQDFTKILRERMGGLTVHFFPVQVQGKDAVPSIINALQYFNNHPNNLDVLVIARGGGSLEDLIAFNDEQIVRAVFASKIPTICAVGHEGNVSLCDLVADLRASTPSNAAELLTPHRNELIRHVDQTSKLLASLFHKRLEFQQHHLHQTNLKLRSRLSLVVQSYLQKIGDHQTNLIRLINQTAKNHQENLVNLTRLLNSLDYKNTLARGFSITMGEDGKILKTVADIKPGQRLRTTLVDGEIQSRVAPAAAPTMPRLFEP
jgi:exodeoxyribonuclease VII large subunit